MRSINFRSRPERLSEAIRLRIPEVASQAKGEESVKAPLEPRSFTELRDGGQTPEEKYVVSGENNVLINKSDE